MNYEYFSKNGQVLPVEQAVIPIDNIAYAYGYGVYETIRVSKGIIYFATDHLERLQLSAQTLGLEHVYSDQYILGAVHDLLQENQADTCNIKIMLVGGATPALAELYIMCLNPLFPDRKLYQSGAKLITYEAERPFPHAKSLNMLQSYIAYGEAKKAGAYDALLVDRDGTITEGTRTNVFAMKDKTIVSPPEDQLLLGVMRKVVLKVAADSGFKITEDIISPASLHGFDSVFITSTSSKIMPIRSVDKTEFIISKPLRELMSACNTFLVGCGGKLD